MEIAALKIGDVLGEERELRTIVALRKAGTKNHKGGFAYLTNPTLRNSLAAYLGTKSMGGAKCSFDEPLFTTKRGGPFSPSSMSRHFTTLYHRAGFVGCTSHTGRRSLARNLNRAGVSVYNIQKILRHADIAQTVRYIDVDEEMLSGIMQAL
jgi:integrase/recombinase XerD